MVQGIGQHSYLYSKKLARRILDLQKRKNKNKNKHTTNKLFSKDGAVNVANNILKGDFLELI